MITYDLKGRKALVTGAASGIGLATATMIAKAGGSVAINFLPDDGRGKESVAKLKAEGLSVCEAPGNVAVAGEAEAMVRRAIDDLGGLNFLGNNAGTPGVRLRVPPPDLDQITEELWNTVLQTNLIGLFRCAKAAGAALKQGKGAIVNTASIAGFDAAGSSMAYGASKAGVVSLTKNLARAFGPEVRVNAVAPGAVDSSWQIDWGEDGKRRSAEKALLKRRATTDEIAEVIVFLGFGAAMVTGQTLVVDGGMTLN